MIDPKAKRILIVEDELLVAMNLEDLLIEMGHEVVGLASHMSEAMEFARESDFNFAALDINIAGTPSFPVADILRERGIPFIFTSGYGAAGLVDGYRDEIMLQKPYGYREVGRSIARAVNPDR